MDTQLMMLSPETKERHNINSQNEFWKLQKFVIFWLSVFSLPAWKLGINYDSFVFPGIDVLSIHWNPLSLMAVPRIIDLAIGNQLEAENSSMSPICLCFITCKSRFEFN